MWSVDRKICSLSIDSHEFLNSGLIRSFKLWPLLIHSFQWNHRKTNFQHVSVVCFSRYCLTYTRFSERRNFDIFIKTLVKSQLISLQLRNPHAARLETRTSAPYYSQQTNRITRTFNGSRLMAQMYSTTTRNLSVGYLTFLSVVRQCFTLKQFFKSSQQVTKSMRESAHTFSRTGPVSPRVDDLNVGQMLWSVDPTVSTCWSISTRDWATSSRWERLAIAIGMPSITHSSTRRPLLGTHLAFNWRQE